MCVSSLCRFLAETMYLLFLFYFIIKSMTFRSIECICWCRRLIPGGWLDHAWCDFAWWISQPSKDQPNILVALAALLVEWHTNWIIDSIWLIRQCLVQFLRTNVRTLSSYIDQPNVIIGNYWWRRVFSWIQS